MRSPRRHRRPPATRTPAVLKALLVGVPSTWTETPDTAPTAGDPSDAVGHLISAEIDDWISATERIRGRGTSKPFDPLIGFRPRRARCGHPADRLVGEVRRAPRPETGPPRRADRGPSRRGPSWPPPVARRGDPQRAARDGRVHDLDHVSQIFAGMAGSHDADAGL